MSDDPKPPAPDYTLPEIHIEEREALRDAWDMDRATIGHALLAMLPVDQQPAGLRLWGGLERDHQRHTARLQAAWRAECQRAYQAGIQQANGNLHLMDTVGSNPASATDPAPSKPH